jgi:NADPH:quinone reductase-like Zn-dependent oxidoreductase
MERQACRGDGCRLRVVRPGAHAEFFVAPSSWLSKKPEGLEYGAGGSGRRALSYSLAVTCRTRRPAKGGATALRVGGRQIAITNATGPDAEVQLNLTDFYHSQLHLIGVHTQKLTGPQVAGLMNHLREGFQAGYLRVSQPEINRFDQAIEAYARVSERKTRTKQVLVFG